MFEVDLQLGKKAEALLSAHFDRNGIYLEQTVGKNEVDFYLPDRSRLEVKFDARSMTTQNGCIELPTLHRDFNYIAHIICSTYFFSKEQYEELYKLGYQKAKVGDQGYQSSLIQKQLIQKYGTSLEDFTSKVALYQKTKG